MNKTLLATITCLGAVTLQLNAADPVLCGSVYSTTDAEFATGVYKIPISSSGDLLLVAPTEQKATGGGFYADGIYYVSELNNSYSFYGGNNVYPYNTDDWTSASSVYLSGSPAWYFMTSGFAPNIAGAGIFGIGANNNRDGFQLNKYTFGLESTMIEYTKVADMTMQLGAPAFNAEGILYAIDAAGALYTVSTADGSVAKAGDTGVTPLVDGSYVPYIHASSVFNTATGMMYLSAQAADGVCSLYEVNTATAAATKLRDFPAGVVVTGLYMAEPDADPAAPAAVSELAANFAPGSLSGNISFKAPGKTYGGADLSGNLDYRVLANGTQIAAGRVYTNVEISVPVEVKERGTYEFKVIVSNSAGDGPAAKITAAVGYAAPAQPVVNATAYGSSIKITWEAVTTTADGSPLTANVSYRVVRYPDGKIIEENATYTSAWDSGLGDELAAYTYGVTAIANGTPSEEGRSATIVTGSIKPPYSESFEDASSMDFFKIIDANNDGRTWDFYNGEIRSQASDEADADDWFMSPPISFGADKYYTVSLKAHVYNSELPGKFEVLMGPNPDPASMETVVIPATEVTVEQRTEFKGHLHSKSSAPQYLGIHAITEAGNWWLFATDLSISDAFDSTVPAAPTDFTATADINGEQVITLSLTAPLTDLGGSTLLSIDKIELMRDGRLIHTYENPAPGARLEDYVDRDVRLGDHTYSAVATNWSGTGIEATATAYSGINLPGRVSQARVYSTDQAGFVTIEWDPVTTYIDGKPLNPDNVTYNIYTNVTGQDMKILAGLKETKTTFQIFVPEEDNPQMFFQFGVTAETEAGENTEGYLTDYVSLGDPYALPYEDSFPDLSLEYNCIQGGSDSYSYWDVATDATFEEVQSQDGDNGLLAMFSQYKGATAYFKTGLIDLSGAENPMLTFYLNNYYDVNLPNDNTIEVSVGIHNVFTSVKTVKLSDFGTEGWHRVEVPLTDYAGKVVQIQLVGTANTYQYTHMDNFKVMDRNTHDIAVMAVNAPERVKAGNSANITVDFGNFGLEDASAFTLELYADGELADSKEFAGMASDGRDTYVFPAVHSVATPESVEYTVKAAYTADVVLANNESEPFTVMTIYPNYPAVTDLKATFTEEDNKAVTLTWSQPDLTADFADEITEGFEGAAAWTLAGLEDWTFIDADGKCIYGFSFFNLPEYAPQPDSQQSWWAFDDTYAPMVQHFSDPGFYKAHGGHQYIGSMAVTDGAALEYTPRKCDDWAISPMLYGGSQTISFWAKSMLADALETVEVLYSTTGKAPADFTSLKTFSDVPWKWTQYFVQLPAGAKYFAIRNIGRDQYVLMIDDVTFTPSSADAVLEVEGYNVYRDGKRINEATVGTTTYADVLPDAASHAYTVTTLYRQRGESMFSNEAVPELMGVTDAAADGIRISAIAGGITVDGVYGTGIAVYGIDGRVVAQTAGTGHDSLAVAPGTYIVKAGAKVAKLTVR